MKTVKALFIFALATTPFQTAFAACSYQRVCRGLKCSYELVCDNSGPTNPGHTDCGYDRICGRDGCHYKWRCH